MAPLLEEGNFISHSVINRAPQAAASVVSQLLTDASPFIPNEPFRNSNEQIVLGMYLHEKRLSLHTHEQNKDFHLGTHFPCRAKYKRKLAAQNKISALLSQLRKFMIYQLTNQANRSSTMQTFYKFSIISTWERPASP